MVVGELRRGAEGLEKTENGLVIQLENEPETLVNMKRFQKKNLEIQPAECLSQQRKSLSRAHRQRKSAANPPLIRANPRKSAPRFAIPLLFVLPGP